MLRLELYRTLPCYFGRSCNVYIANNGYKSIETMAGKVRYNTPIWECCSNGHKYKYESKRLLKKKPIKPTQNQYNQKSVIIIQ